MEERPIIENYASLLPPIIDFLRQHGYCQDADCHCRQAVLHTIEDCAYILEQINSAYDDLHSANHNPIDPPLVPQQVNEQNVSHGP